jgi:hypothetical protein
VDRDIRFLLGRVLARLALRLLEPRPDEPFDASRSQEIDQLVVVLDEERVP